MNRGLNMDVVMPGNMGLSGDAAAAYFRLCWALWCHRGRLENSALALARFAGVPAAQWGAVWDAIGDRFGAVDGDIFHAAVSEAWWAEENRRDRAHRSSAAGVAARIANRKKAQQLVSVKEAQHPTQPVNNQSTTSQQVVDDLLPTRARLNPDQTGEDPSLRSGVLFSGSGSESSLPIRSGSGSDAREDRVNRQAAAIREVFAHYRTLHPRALPKPTSKAKEWVKIAARLAEGHSVEDLCRAIDGYHLSPFHCGDNDRQEKYLDLDLIMRDASHVNRGIEYATTPPTPIMTAKERRTARAIQSILADTPTPPPEEGSPWNTSGISVNSAWR